MSIIFNPGGTLNIATDPSDLPVQSDGFNQSSDAMTRSKNVDITRAGQITTRKGSSTVGNQMAYVPSRIEILNGVRYSLADAIYNDESSIGTGYINAWSSIQYNAYNDTTDQVFALNGTSRVRIEGSSIYNWGIEAPTTAPTAIVGSAGSLTGDYSIKYTYVRKVGSVVVAESNPSDASSTITLSSEDLDFTVTASSDAQVTHIRIYRTAADGSSYLYDQEITGTSGSSTQVDTALGTTVAIDHNRPPTGNFVCGPNYNGTCFVVDDNLLYYCLPKQPEYWPSTYYIEVSTRQFPGQCVVFWNGQPYYFTKNKIFYIQGTGHPSFQPLDMSAKTGCQGPQAAFATDNEGIYHVGFDGIYLFNGQDRKITENNLDPIFQGETKNGIPAATDLSKSWLIEFRNKIYCGYVGTGTYPDNVLVLHLDTGKIAYYSFPFEIRTVQLDVANSRLIAGCDDGYNRILETGTQDSSVDINWEIESKAFTLSTRAHFPRWCKYDIEVTSGTVTGSIVLDDAILQNHTISGSRDTKRRLITTDNGKRCAIRIVGTGVSTVYAVEME